jgi:hypothetical protein
MASASLKLLLSVMLAIYRGLRHLPSFWRVSIFHTCWTPEPAEGMTDISCNMITADKVPTVRIYVFPAKSVTLTTAVDSGMNWDKAAGAWPSSDG